MLKFVILLCSVACVFGAVVPGGMLPQLDGRIVGGVEADIEDFPWQVSIQRRGYHFCGGSIYSPEIIVTAAHCLEKTDASQLRVRVGSSYWGEGGSLLTVSHFKMHEKYNPRSLWYDVALIKLSSKLTYGPTVKNIELAKKTPPHNADAVVSGWGRIYENYPYLPEQLRSVDVKIVSREVCRSGEYGYGNAIGPTMICAYAVGKDSCQGDSGGPLVVGEALVGVVSWGDGCAYPGFPGVYTDVSIFRSWIIDNAKSI
uniref:Hypodermin B n=1 Tax=Hypoderma bovis TaxID=123734 RepID=A0A5B9T2T9_HYPBO|nr:hypodermin B [Hypoderma bovis]